MTPNDYAHPNLLLQTLVLANPPPHPGGTFMNFWTASAIMATVGRRHQDDRAHDTEERRQRGDSGIRCGHPWP